MAKYLQIWTFKKLGDDHYGRKLFHTGYIDIDFIHFEGTFLTNIIARQSNGEMSTTTIGHNYLQNVTKIFISAHSFGQTF